jgi:hypothetical protein
MEEHDHPQALGLLPEGVEPGIVGVEMLARGIQLADATHAELVVTAPQLVHRSP